MKSINLAKVELSYFRNNYRNNSSKYPKSQHAAFDLTAECSQIWRETSCVTCLRKVAIMGIFANAVVRDNLQ